LSYRKSDFIAVVCKYCKSTFSFYFLLKNRFFCLVFFWTTFSDVFIPFLLMDRRIWVGMSFVNLPKPLFFLIREKTNCCFHCFFPSPLSSSSSFATSSIFDPRMEFNSSIFGLVSNERKQNQLNLKFLCFRKRGKQNLDHQKREKEMLPDHL
jgi:hypothetical protein